MKGKEISATRKVLDEFNDPKWIEANIEWIKAQTQKDIDILKQVNQIINSNHNMKTFEDILHETNNGGKIIFTSSDIGNILSAFNRWEIHKKQEGTKSEIIKILNENEIQEFNYDPNYIDKSKYNDAFHPPFGCQSGFSLLTVKFKIKI